MAYELFDFPYHTFEIVEPDDVTRVQFGKGWEFASEPDGPPQRIYKLEFPAMIWFLDESGNIDRTTKRELNVGALQQFYRDHGLWREFQYQNPVDGLLVCRFNKPLTIPKATEGGTGVVEKIQIELRSIPQ